MNRFVCGVLNYLNLPWILVLLNEHDCAFVVPFINVSQHATCICVI